MPKGWSLYKNEGTWLEEECAKVECSDAGLVFEIERDGDIVAVSTQSPDGNTYQGDYRYREGSNSNGEVVLARYKGTTGDVFIGEWKESDTVRGSWLIHLVAAAEKT